MLSLMHESWGALKVADAFWKYSPSAPTANATQMLDLTYQPAAYMHGDECTM